MPARRRAGHDRPRQDPASAPLSAEDRQVTAAVDGSLRRGLDLLRWWKGRDGPFEERFELAFTHNRPDTSFGFFATAEVDGKPFPVLGNLQEMFYDRPKSGVTRRSPAAEHVDRQLREFVLHYFMRVADFRPPQPYSEGQPQPPLLLSPLSWCFRDDAKRAGFGYRQLYYKLRDGGEVGRFPEDRQRAVDDLREVGRRYAWIVLRVDIFDFRFVLQPYGDRSPSVDLPLAESSLLVVAPPFVVDEHRPRPQELGHYGFGYAFVRNPRPTLVGWGPGKFEAAFQTIDFHVLDDGRIRVRMVFVADRPRRIGNLPLNPLLAGAEGLDLLSGGRTATFTEPVRRLASLLPGSDLRLDPVLPMVGLVDAVTGGLARRAFCISRRQIEKRLLLVHFLQHYNAILGSLQTWRQIPDWLDETTLPPWVVSGDSA